MPDPHDNRRTPPQQALTMARALRTLIAVARQQLAAGDAVEPLLWEAIDATATELEQRLREAERWR